MSLSALSALSKSILATSAKMSHDFCWIAVCIFSLLAPLQAQNQNSIKIRDEENKNISGANVRLSNKSDDSKSKSGKGDDKGDIGVSQLEDGEYKVCIDNPELLIVDECKWKKNPQTLNIQGGKVKGNPEITVQRGAILQIHVNDQFRTLVRKAGQAQTPILNSFITGETSIPFGMRLVRRNARGMDYELVVPFDSNLKISMRGSPVLLSINQGARSDASKSGAAAQVRIPKGSRPNVIRVDIHEATK